jgi:hypothetical protein
VNWNSKESNNPRFQPLESKTIQKSLNTIESKGEWTVVHSKSSKKIGKESQGIRRLGKVSKDKKEPGELEDNTRIHLKLHFLFFVKAWLTTKVITSQPEQV